MSTHSHIDSRRRHRARSSARQPFAFWKPPASSLSGRVSPPAPKPSRSTSEYIPKELNESIERTQLGLKGPVTTPVGGGFSSINVALAQAVRAVRKFPSDHNLPAVPTRYPDVDLIVVRENTEGLYSGHRARSGAGRGGEPEDHHRKGFHAHLQASPSSMRASTSAKRSTPFTKPTS